MNKKLNLAPVNDRLKWVTATLCAWEIVAIATGKVPTISTICAKNKYVGAMFVAALTVHLVEHRQRVTATAETVNIGNVDVRIG